MAAFGASNKSNINKLSSFGLVLSVLLSQASCDSLQETPQPSSDEQQLSSLALTTTVDSLEVDSPTIDSSKISTAHADGYIAPEKLAEKLDHPVNDFTNTLSAAERKLLDDKIRTIYDKGILQIGIAIVETTGDMPIFDYAMVVANQWALGTPENNNGLFILIAIEDQKIYILTGLDIEDELTDERVKTIINKEITPYFPDANYAAGLSKGIDALVEQMRQNQ